MVWSTPIMANNLKNKVTLKVRLFRRLSEVLLRRFVASPVKSVMPSTSSLCKCRIIILNNHKYSSFFYEDAKYSYKQAYGYFPGVVSIDGIIAYIETVPATAAYSAYGPYTVSQCTAAYKIYATR